MKAKSPKRPQKQAKAGAPREPSSGPKRSRSATGDGKPLTPTPARPARAPASPAPAARPAAAAAGDGQRPGLAPLPIVGIGASAGGLEALELFLRHLPPRTGMGYVVVQHLDPTRKGAMVELLQHVSPIPVVEVSDRQAVEPDHVYVIPPGKDLSILHGTLHLLPLSSTRGVHLPIDSFFRSLAEDRQERAIGVVLSGMGSDGTLGLRAIKEKAGATFVQAPPSAKFDSMPRSAVEAGLADIVAPAEDLPARILAYHHHAAYIVRASSPPEEKQQSALEKVLLMLRAKSGCDFSLYKRSTVQRRIERRMGLHQVDRLPDYVRYLRENPRETELLFKELLIGVTSFFRDPDAWDVVRKKALPELLAARSARGPLRAWVTACSTGEEAYSLAMALTEAIEECEPARRPSFQIFATDLDRDAIEKARQGFYPANIAADVPADRLRRFFAHEENGYRIRKEIRDSIVFAPHNVLVEPPFTKLDLLLCRNLLIYLSAELQKKLLPVFHYSLNRDGLLFLGNAETAGAFSDLFGVLDGKARLYRRLHARVGLLPEFATTLREIGPRSTGDVDEPAAGRPANLQSLADRVIVQRFSPAAVLTNDKGDVLYTSARTGRYLEPAVGKANLNVFAMAREGLGFELSAAFHSALQADRPVVVRGISVRTNGDSQLVDLTVVRLAEPRELRGTMLIVIADAPASAAPAPRPPRSAGGRAPGASEMERELQRAREEIQIAREEMQTSQEELKSTNEELQSTNEELQSSNEELTTSKEEMQSMNEELQTVNQELQSKVDDLARTNNDMRNLLNSTDIATLFLDSGLLVRRFTTQTRDLIKLIPSDVGRPITDIASDIAYPDLADDARDVLRTLIFKEKQVAARDGRWFTVRIMPYRTVDNVIDGVVLTFSDSTSLKGLELRLQEQADLWRRMVESLPALVWGCRADGSWEFVSSGWRQYTGVLEEDALGDAWLAQVHPDDREHLREEWRGAVRSGLTLATDFRLRSKEGAFRWFRMMVVPVRGEGTGVLKWQGTAMDVDELKNAPATPARPAAETPR